MPESPSILSESGRNLWSAVCGQRDVTPEQAEILILACKQADRAAEARRILSADAIIGEDRFGQLKPHPAVAIERQASLACARLVEVVTGKVPEPEEQEADFE
ncbi:MAG: hypothetical protein ACKV0T_27835 [Planctomycetales bacterium]